MKKLNIISAALMGVVLFSIPVQAGTEIIVATVTTDLYVREQPDKNSDIIDVLPGGKEVEVSGSSKEDWNKIDFEDYSGYVYNAYLAADSTSIGEAETEEALKQPIDTKIDKIYTQEEFIHSGVISWNGWNWTYYLMSMFPGSTSTPVEGRHVNDDGFVCDGDGYIILASVDLAPYTIVETPFGYIGKVYDTGCPSGVLDVYTNW